MIRKAVPGDASQLAILFDEYRVFYHMEPDIEKCKVFLEQRLAANESVVFISAEDNDELTGFSQLYPLFSSTRLKRLWLLNDLFVLPAYRGRGISVALISEAKKLCIATGGCGLSLETAKSNTIGNLLYPKAGFNLDEDHNYYFWTNG